MGRMTNAFLNISDWTEQNKLVSWHIPIHYVTFFTILDLQCFLLLKQVLELRTWRYHMLCFSLYHYLIDPDENTQKCSCLSLYSFNSLKSLNSFGDYIITPKYLWEEIRQSPLGFCSGESENTNANTKTIRKQ